MIRVIQWGLVWGARNAIAFKNAVMAWLDPWGEDDENNRDHER